MEGKKEAERWVENRWKIIKTVAKLKAQKKAEDKGDRKNKMY